MHLVSVLQVYIDDRNIESYRFSTGHTMFTHAENEKAVDLEILVDDFLAFYTAGRCWLLVASYQGFLHKETFFFQQKAWLRG